MTAATTRMCGTVLMGSAGDAEELLTHQQHLPVLERLGALHLHVGAVRAAEIGEEDLPALVAETAVHARDVAVLGEEDLAALAAEVEPRLGNGKGGAGGIPAQHHRDAADVALERRAHGL